MKMRYVLYLWYLIQMASETHQDVCPQICVCRSLGTHTDCSFNSLTELPDCIFTQVASLDLAYNLFTHIPEKLSNFKELQYLNISHNRIKEVDSNSLQHVNTLKVLDLSYNLFTEWMDINRTSLAAVPGLQKLDLSFNNLGGFPDIMDHPLDSNSLETLSLVNCSITNLLGDILTGLSNLKNLILAKNPLMGLNTQLKSSQLQKLDLSQCRLQRIHPETFTGLSALETLTLANNYQLKSFNSKSISMKVLDLSHCNLDRIPKVNLPNLTKLNLQGNHIRQIPENSFIAWPLINLLDLSSNAIVKIDLKAFQDLKDVQNINLSFNKILSVDHQTFTANTKLLNLDISRNYLSEIGQLVIHSLKWLDLSVCEIRGMNKDSLIMMPKLQNLNLSRNLITHLPSEMQAQELRTLDLSRCGIYQLNNSTFARMPKLNYLNLAGNKLVSVKSSYFSDVKVLYLDDNAWFCNCVSDEFKDLHHWLYNLMSISGLYCRYPENVAGLTWEKACAEVWYVPETGNSDVWWIYSVSVVIIMAAICCLVGSLRHAYYRKVCRSRQQQLQELEEVQERLRCMDERSIQESSESVNRNAPDPRATETPPSYAEAISMQRLNISFNSLIGSNRSLPSLHSLQSETPNRRTKVRRKRRRSKRENKSPTFSETQSAAASLARSQTEESSADEQTYLQRGGWNKTNVMESSF